MRITLTPSQFIWLANDLRADHAEHLASANPTKASRFSDGEALRSRLARCGRVFDDEPLREALLAFVARRLRRLDFHPADDDETVRERLERLQWRLRGKFDYPQTDATERR